MKRTFNGLFNFFKLTVPLAVVMMSCNKGQYAGPENQNAAVIQNDASFASVCGTIPDTLNVPKGNKLILQTFAKGVQIYEVQRSATDPTKFLWVNIAPLATLYTKEDFTNKIIDHFAGPSWKFTKGRDEGETVVAKKVSGITEDPNSIQWLLLKADESRSSAGNRITFIQRVCTRGGLARETGADAEHLGQLDSIPYTASYLFYTAEEDAK